MTDKIYAVGDIHGQLGMLKHTLELIENDGGPDARIVFLGDYIDRGADSHGVLSHLLDGCNRGRNWICLMGNHDRMFAMFMEDYPRHDAQFLIGYHWFDKRIGGIETMKSYGIDVSETDRIYNVHVAAKRAVPTAHIGFLNSLGYFHQEGDYLFVHAGIKPGIPLNAQNKDDLIWIRHEFLRDTRKHPWVVIHGHTPTKGVVEHHGNRINVDTGAGHGRTLSAVVFEGAHSWVLSDAGRIPLTPPQ